MRYPQLSALHVGLNFIFWHMRFVQICQNMLRASELLFSQIEIDFSMENLLHFTHACKQI